MYGSGSGTSEKEKRPAFQPNLFAFFASNVRTPPHKKPKRVGEGGGGDDGGGGVVTGTANINENNTKKTSNINNASMDEDPNDEASVKDNQDGTPTGTASNTSPATSSSSHNDEDPKDNDGIPPPLFPAATPTPPTITWQSLKNNHILMRRSSPMFFGANANGGSPQDTPRSKVAAFDMDGTLFVWRCSGYPNNFADYEVWNRTMFDKMRDLYQNQGYQLLIISNQGYIQKAHTGKTAQRVQNLVNWIAAQVGCPLSAILSTMSPKKSNASYHKPNPQLFQVAQSTLKATWDLNESFFVGDSENLLDAQGGVDRRFAQNVGLQFFTPDEYFGPSDASRRRAKMQTAKGSIVPTHAQEARAALLGGYWRGPILLLLCGVQGSGKSTFADALLRRQGNHNKDNDDDDDDDTEGSFVHLCQDVLKQRDKVEAATREALKMGKSVIVDRMHLTRDQREPFLRIGVDAKVPVHVIVFQPPADVISRRVLQRTNHPGKVQGEQGAQLALRSMHQLVLPTYEEDEAMTLISMASNDKEADRLVQLYAKATQDSACNLVQSYVALSEECQMPCVVLGTMNVGKRVGKEMVLLAAQNGFRGFDTAPTYNNEEAIGEGLVDLDSGTFCIAKIPRSPNWGGTVKKSFQSSLGRLQRSSVDLLLMHWPTQDSGEGGIVEVWREMEAIYREGKCKALGVCNFNAAALSELLSNTSIPPVVNQVERHPLLPQMDLMDFCGRHNIHIQAHTPLGQGRDELLANDVVLSIARETSQSPANVVLQWNLQQGVSVVPKCQRENHMRELFQSKALSADHMKRLDGLGCGKRFVAPHFMFGSAPYCWSP